MNREIKFRSWIDNEIYCNEDNLYNRLDKDGNFIPFMQDLSEWYIENKTTLIDDLTSMPNLMQYTGIKDKNNKKIFEGDIVKIPENECVHGSNAGEIYEVYFAYGGFRLKPKYNNQSKGFWIEDNNELEILGNIHENPELLKH